MLLLKKEARKKVFERLINRREGRKQSRAEYEEMKERRVLLEKNPLEFYSSPHLESFKWGSFHRWARPSLVLFDFDLFSLRRCHRQRENRVGYFKLRFLLGVLCRMLLFR